MRVLRVKAVAGFGVYGIVACVLFPIASVRAETVLSLAPMQISAVIDAAMVKGGAPVTSSLLKKLAEQVFPIVEGNGSGVVLKMDRFSKPVLITANHVAGIPLKANEKKTGALLVEAEEFPFLSLNYRGSLGENFAPLEKTSKAKVFFIPPKSEGNSVGVIPNPGSDFVIGVVDEKSLYSSIPQGKVGQAVKPGEVVVTLGYPIPGNTDYSLVAGYGNVVDSESAQAIVAEDLKQLKLSSAKQTALAFQPEREFLMNGIGIPGMSGGAVYNAQGDLLGIMDSIIFPKGYDHYDPQSIAVVLKDPALQRKAYIRVIRADYILNQLELAAQKLKAPQMEKLKASTGYVPRVVSACVKSLHKFIGKP